MQKHHPKKVTTHIILIQLINNFPSIFGTSDIEWINQDTFHKNLINEIEKQYNLTAKQFEIDLKSVGNDLTQYQIKM